MFSYYITSSNLLLWFILGRVCYLADEHCWCVCGWGCMLILRVMQTVVFEWSLRLEGSKWWQGHYEFQHAAELTNYFCRQTIDWALRECPHINLTAENIAPSVMFWHKISSKMPSCLLLKTWNHPRWQSHFAWVFCVAQIQRFLSGNRCCTALPGMCSQQSDIPHSSETSWYTLYRR